MQKNAVIPFALALALAIPAQAQIQPNLPQHQQAKATMDAAYALARDPAAPAMLSGSDDMSLAAFEQRWAAMLKLNGTHQFTSAVNADLLTSMAQAVACDDIVGFSPSGFARNALDAKLLDGATLFARCGYGDFIVITARSAVSQPGHAVVVDPAAYPLTIAGLPARKLYYKSSQGREKTVLAMLGADIVYSISSWSHGDRSAPRMTTAAHIDQAAAVLAAHSHPAPLSW